jgi:hypothetical protein
MYGTIRLKTGLTAQARAFAAFNWTYAYAPFS